VVENYRNLQIVGKSRNPEFRGELSQSVLPSASRWSCSRRRNATCLRSFWVSQFLFSFPTQYIARRVCLVGGVSGLNRGDFFATNQAFRLTSSLVISELMNEGQSVTLDFTNENISSVIRSGHSLFRWGGQSKLSRCLALGAATPPNTSTSMLIQESEMGLLKDMGKDDSAGF
jgi:hypothetical protein